MQKNNDKKPKELLTKFKNVLFVYKLIWSFSPARIILTFVSDVIDFGFWIFETTVLMRYLFGSEEFSRSFSEVVMFLLFTLLFRLVSRVFISWINNKYKPLNDQEISKQLSQMLFKKAGNLELECYDNTDFYNNYTLVMAESFNKSMGIISGGSQLIVSLISSLIIIINLCFISIYIGSLALIPVIINLIFSLKEGKIYYKRNVEYIPYQRRQDYVNRTIYLQDFSKEFRVSNIFKVLTRTYDNAMQDHIKITKKHQKRLFWFSFIKNTIVSPLFFNGIWLLGAFLVMIIQTVHISDFVVIAKSTITATVIIGELAQGISTINNSSLYIENLKKFLEYKEKIPEDQPGLPVPNKIETIQFKNVSFKYHESSPYVIRNINFSLKTGEIVSFVGENGAGKSTIIKLITRLYDPTDGDILLNGINIKEFELAQYRALIGTAFQDFKIFSLPIIDNVLMGNEHYHSDIQATTMALKQSGIYDEIAKMPRGLDTIMTKEFDQEGVVLSGGMQQKIALARAFAKKSSILLLDEPSSALDPFSEDQVFRAMIMLCKDKNYPNKISVFVSHRMTSSTMADRVFVIQNNEIVEEGNHEFLIKLDSIYASMFNKQAKNYKGDYNEQEK